MDEESHNTPPIPPPLPLPLMPQVPILLPQPQLLLPPPRLRLSPQPRLPPLVDSTSFLESCTAANPYQFQFLDHPPQVQRRSYWDHQYREIEQASNFRRQRLPLNAIERIMKEDEDVRMISPETLVIFSRACEMFIIELAHKGWAHAQEKNRLTIQKEDIAAAVTRTDTLDFLADVVTTEAEEAMDVAAPTAALPSDPFDPMHYYFLQ